MAGTAALALDDPARAGSPPEMGEEELALCGHGDPAALRRFVVRYQPLVFAFVSRALGHGPHVEDLAQEAFLRAVRALPRYDVRGAGKPSTWLLTIVAHLVADARKRKVEALHAGAEPAWRKLARPERPRSAHRASRRRGASPRRMCRSSPRCAANCGGRARRRAGRDPKARQGASRREEAAGAQGRSREAATSARGRTVPALQWRSALCREPLQELGATPKALMERAAKTG